MLVVPQDFLEEWTVCFFNKRVSLELFSILTGQRHIRIVLTIPHFIFLLISLSWILCYTLPSQELVILQLFARGGWCLSDARGKGWE